MEDHLPGLGSVTVVRISNPPNYKVGSLTICKGNLPQVRGLTMTMVIRTTYPSPGMIRYSELAVAVIGENSVVRVRVVVGGLGCKFCFQDIDCMSIYYMTTAIVCWNANVLIVSGVL